MLWRRRRIKRRRLPDDRRREPRFADGVEIHLISKDPAGVSGAHRSLYVLAKDVSPSGLRVESAEQLPVGTVLAVKFQSPKTRKDIRATAEVKWSAPAGTGETYEIGLEFIETSAHSILDFIEHIYKA